MKCTDCQNKTILVEEVTNLKASKLSKKGTQQPDTYYHCRRPAKQRLKAFTVTIEWVTSDEYGTNRNTAQSLINNDTMDCDNG